MTDILISVLNMSAAASIAAIAVIIARLPLKKAPKIFSYALWVVVFLRLVCPIHFESKVSLMPTSAEIIPHSIVYEPVPRIESGVPVVDVPLNQFIENSLPEANPAASVNPVQIALSVAAYVWVLGVVLLLSYAVVGYIRLKRRVYDATTESGIVYRTDKATTAFVLGFISPKIFIPLNISGAQLEHILRHEQVHIKRRDYLIKPLAFVILAVHWFNPVVWISYYLMSKDMEMSCDEAVLRGSEGDLRQDYSMSLVNLYARKPALLSPLAFGEGSYNNMKARVKNVLNFKKTPKWAIMTCSFLLVLFVAGFTTNQPQRLSEITNLTAMAQNPQQVLDNRLSLTKKEYTIEQLRTQNISGIVVEALSENVMVTSGGETLKIEYYTLNPNDYSLQVERVGGDAGDGLYLTRTAPLSSNEPSRNITVTIPEGVGLQTVIAETVSGNINIVNCSANHFMGVTSQSGQISVNGGSATNMFKVETDSGNAAITKPTLGNDDFRIFLDTQSGAFSFQPIDSIENYCVESEIGADAKMVIEGKEYTGGGSFEINPQADKRIYFDSPEGSLIIQGSDAGILSSDNPSPAPQIIPQPITEPAYTVPAKLTAIRKEYTTEELQTMNITGIRVNALTDDVVLTQGGSSLIVEYAQEQNEEYTFETKEYQLYMDGYGPVSQAGLPGTIKTLVFSRTGTALSGEARRTIHVNLPTDLNLNRVVMIITDSGNISADSCNSLSQLDLMTKTGNIAANRCGSEILSVKTDTGKIEVSGHSAADKLDISAWSGTAIVHLPNSASAYEIAVSTGRKEAQIIVDGKTYQGGDYILNENAANKISFDGWNGTLSIDD